PPALRRVASQLAALRSASVPAARLSNEHSVRIRSMRAAASTGAGLSPDAGRVPRLLPQPGGFESRGAVAEVPPTCDLPVAERKDVGIGLVHLDPAARASPDQVED